MKLKEDLPQLYFVAVIDLFTTVRPLQFCLCFSIPLITAVNNYKRIKFLVFARNVDDVFHLKYSLLFK